MSEQSKFNGNVLPSADSRTAVDMKRLRMIMCGLADCLQAVVYSVECRNNTGSIQCINVGVRDGPFLLAVSNQTINDCWLALLSCL